MTAGHTNRDFCWFSTLSSSPATCKNRTSIWIILSSLASQTPKGACRLCVCEPSCNVWRWQQIPSFAKSMSANPTRTTWSLCPKIRKETTSHHWKSEPVKPPSNPMMLACSISSQPYSLFSGPLRLAIWLSFVPTGSRGTHCRRFLDPADLFPSHSS